MTDVRKGILLTNIMSMHNSHKGLSSYGSGGISIWSETIGSGFFLVVLPLRVPMSKPNVFSAKSPSLTCTGRFAMAFMLMIFFKSATLGVPKSARRSLAKVKDSEHT